MKGKITRLTLGLALAVTFALPAAQMTFADHDHDFKEDCHRRIESDRAKVDREAAKHGEHSRQVDRAVDKLQAESNGAATTTPTGIINLTSASTFTTRETRCS